jgi:hypothetical protein
VNTWGLQPRLQLTHLSGSLFSESFSPAGRLPRKDEVLGLTWELVDLDAAELYVGEQVQRVGRELIRRQVKTETSEAPLPLPELCVAAFKIRRAQQETDRDRAHGAQGSGVFRSYPVLCGM